MFYELRTGLGSWYSTGYLFAVGIVEACPRALLLSRRLQREKPGDKTGGVIGMGMGIPVSSVEATSNGVISGWDGLQWLLPS